MASYTYANLGQEFLVNTKTAGDQQVPHVAALVNGGFVMIWDDVINASNDFDVRGQRYDANGAKVGGEFLVNSTTAGLQGLSMVTSLASGGFVVSWTDNSSGTNDVRAQLYDAAGAKVGGSILVNTATAGEQLQSSLASLDTGGFVATWRTSSNGSADGLDLKGQVFDATGAKVGGEFTVSTDAFQQSDAVVESFSSGRFAVAWTSATAARVGFVDPGVVKVQLFEPNGTKVGSEITVAAAADTQARPAIAVLSGGGFVVTWQQAGASGDGSEYGIKAQLFDANGAKVGAEFLANTTTANTQELARVTALDTGGFIISWSDETGDGSQYGVKAQIFEANGAKRGGEILLNGTTGDDQIFSTIAQLTGGRVVAGWEDHSGVGGDVDAGIKAQLLALFNSATIAGSASSDQLTGTFANDAMEGLAGNDTLVSGTGDDILVGGDGNDSLIGGNGIDNMTGGVGDDIYYVDHVLDQVFELSGQGNDLLYTSVDFTLTAGLSVEVLSSDFHAGTTPLNLTGNELDNVIYGNAGVNVLVGGGGNDQLIGMGGNDIYHVDSQSDQVFENPGDGSDTIFTSVSYALATNANIETLSVASIAGTAAISLSGNAFDNALIGNAGNNSLSGGGGNDSFAGGAGDDTYYVDSQSDSVTDAAGAGFDIIYSSASYTLAAGASIEILSANVHAATVALNFTGNERDNTIYGNAGANVLSGGGGNDILIGLGGNDTYYLDSQSDIVYENPGDGTDTLYVTGSYVLATGASIEILSSDFHAGTASLNYTGNELDNTIYGNAGANALAGGAGNDTLIGLGGDDVFYVDSQGDQVLESAGNGRDIIYSSVSYALRAGQHVEFLSPDSNLGTAALNFTGNELNNTIYGNAGANILSGGGGDDLLIGLAGNDIYYADSQTDQVVENAGDGLDTLYSTTSYTLAAGVEVEILSSSAHAGTAALNYAGNSFDNQIYGNAGVNTLDGKGGNDLLVGFGGADTFQFTTALNATSNIDRLQTFETGLDKIALDDAIFTGLGVGALPAGAFQVGGAATQADDRIIYNQTTGALFFDADGSGAGAAVQFALLENKPADLSATDFVVI